MSTQNSFATCFNSALSTAGELAKQSTALESSYRAVHHANLIFIDSNVDDYHTLLNGLKDGYQAYILSADKDGVEQITQILTKFDTVETVHLVSHGEPGVLQLGATQLSSQNIHQYQPQWQTWANILSNEAQILLYGCQVAEGEASVEFIQTLSELTGSAIAASTTLVGNAEKAGNWELDIQTQAFNPVLAFDAETLASYPSTLNVNQAFSGITAVDTVDPNLSGAINITITPNSGIQKSNFSAKSFTINNTGDKRIAAIYIDVTDALFPDTVFDPVGLAGDSASRALKFEITGGTGVFVPTQAQELEPFFGEGGADGYEGVLLTFDPNSSNGYNPGETVQFGVDMDPNSIVGLPQNPTDINGNEPLVNSWDIGGVSGAELMNSKVHVLFTDGTQAVGEIIGDGSDGGGVAVADQASPNKQATLTVNNLGAGGAGNYSQSDIEVEVSGNAGDTVRVVMTKGFVQPFDYIDTNGNPVNLSSKFAGEDFPANNALEFQTVDVVLDGSVQDITSLFDFSGPGGNLAFAGNDKLPLGFVSAVIDSNELPIGPVSEPIYLQHSGATAPSNTAPVTSGINNVTVTEGAPDTVISLFDAFADAESTDAQLTYSVTNNSTPGLFDAVAIDPITGELTLDYAATGTGSSNITINAADPEGLSESTTFSVTVNSDGGGGGPVTPPGDAIRIEAENYRPGTNGVEYSDADAGNRGNAAGFTDDVDVETTSDTTGDFNINFIKNDEYLTYDVNIPTAGSYDLVFRVATNRTGPRKLDVTVGGQSYTATFVAAPGGFDGWQDVVISDVAFAAGNQVVRTDFTRGFFDFNYFDIVPAGTGAPSNTAPTTSGINNVTVTEGAPNTVISLFDAFADAQSTDAELTYTIAGNTAPGIFDAVAIDPITGELTLDYAATGTGSSNITVNAEDPEGLSESTTFSVTVNSDGGGGGPVTPPGDAIRIEAENYRPGTNGVEYSDADAGNRGNAAGFTDDVDVETTSDTTGEFNINFIKNNEYLTYDVNIPTAGSYDLVFRVATNRTGPRKLDVTVGGQSYTATFVAAPGGFDGWQDVVISDVTFAAGNQVVRTDFTRGFFDFNYFDIVPAGAGAANTEPTTSGINDVAVLEGAGNTVINLFDSFDDTQSADNELTYSITGNSAPNLFDAATIDPITGQLTLDYAPTGTGSSNLTIEAQDPEGLSTSTTFSVTVSDPNTNTEPTTIGIPDITVEEGASNTIIDVFEVFDDAQSVDTALSFAITGNTNPALFDSVTLDSIPGVLTLDYTAAGTGSSEITIEAEDPEGLKVSTSFTVNVSEPAVPGSAIRIEAENYRPGTNGVEYSDADAGNRGNAAGFTDDVDVEITSDTAGEFNINFIKNDEYLTYDVNMPTAGTYDLVFRVATNRTGPRKLDVTVGGQTYTASFVAAPGGFDGWQDVVISDVAFAAGAQVVRTDFTRGFFDFNYFDIVPAGTGTTNTPPTTSGITDIAVLEGAGNTVISLFDAFDDAQSADTELTYAVASNTNPGLFDAISINPTTGALTLNYAATGIGTSDVTISAEDPEGLTVTTTFAVTITDPNANTAPTTSGIADISVEENANNTVIDLFDAFDDAQDSDTQLTYAVVGNTNAGLFDGININPTTGALTLNYEAVGTGTSELTIEATDSEGATESTDFVVNVAAPNAPDGIVRINAGGGDVYDPDGNLWQADTFFSGGQTFAAPGRPITNADDNFRFDSLYQSQRTGGNFSYAVPLDNGSYRINLHLSELVFDTNDERLFDVSLENEQVFDNLDIFARTKNAFLDGKDTSRVLQLEEELPPPGDVISVEDGTFNINFNASLQNAAIAGIEIVPITTPQVVVKPSDNSTTVSEGGATDTYDIVLTTQPTSDVTININSGSELSTDAASVTFNASNWFQAQTITIEAVDDTQAEGLETASITHTVSSSDPIYQGLSVPDIEASVTDNDQVSPISFTVKEISTINLPTRAAWGPDGRLYVTSLRGEIAAYEFDGDYNIVSTQTISTIEPLDNHEILGIAFNPFDTEPKIYVAHSHLEANGGKPFPVTEFSPYSGQVSVLEGPNFSTLTPLITGLPVSNHDHGVNGLEFDNDGNLYIAVGGNTNAGIVSEAIGGIDESLFTAAVLKAEITKPNFNGDIEYTLSNSFVNNFLQENNLTLADFVLEDGTTQFDLADSQVFGYAADVAPGVDVSVFASGTRNPFDLIHTTQGNLYATDNGANFNAGSASTGANTEAPLGGKQFDELNLLVEGAYYGSPNRSRGRTDARQNVFYGTNNPYEQSIPGVFTEPLDVFGKNSTNGIDEYRANTFGGQLKGNLIAHEYNGKVWNVDLSADGTAVDSIVDLNAINGTDVAEGLDILTGMGGAILGVDIQGNLLTVAVPNDPNATGPAAWDIFPYRAPAVGGSDFIIGGVNFDTADTQVFIGSQEITGLGVTSNRISGVLPSLTAQPNSLLDVRVISGGVESIIPDAFQTLS